MFIILLLTKHNAMEQSHLDLDFKLFVIKHMKTYCRDS